MQSFFGFINFSDSNTFLKKEVYDSSNRTTICHKTVGFDLVLSHTNGSEITLINSDKIIILFNGVIYNRQEIETQLAIEYNSSYNTATLLEKAYIQWKEGLLERLEGTFTLLIFDKESLKLSIAKDAIGRKPLFFYQSDRAIIFGNRLQDFKKTTLFKAEINPNTLANFFQYGYILQPNSIFKNCHKVRSAELVEFDLDKREEKFSKYWSLESCYQEPKIEHSELKVIENAHKLLEISIDKQANRHSMQGISLSGGYDSSLVAALLQEQSGKKIETFTIGFSDSSINEAPHAKIIASYLGTNHNEHYFTAQDAKEIIPKLSEVYDEPFADFAATPTVLITKLAEQRGVELFFVGDGGDEVFATADNVTFFNYINSVPTLLKSAFTKPLLKIAIDRVPYLKNHYNIPTKYDKFLQLLDAHTIPNMVGAKNRLFREKELYHLIKGYSKPCPTAFEDTEFSGHHEIVDEIIGTYFKTVMADGELVKSHSAIASTNMSFRTPFLDRKLIEYMAKVPSSIKIKDGVKKHILKEIAHSYFPKSMLDRPKSGFDIPFSSWMRNELKDLVYSQVNLIRLQEDNILLPSLVIDIRDRFYAGEDPLKYRLWRIFLFQLWYENFKRN